MSVFETETPYGSAGELLVSPFSVPEVDTLTALGNRQGATLMPILRSAWSGEQLSFAYADPTQKSLH